MRTNVRQDTSQIRRISEVTVMKHKILVFDTWVFIDMVYALCIEGGGTALNSVDFVILL